MIGTCVRSSECIKSKGLCCVLGWRNAQFVGNTGSDDTCFCASTDTLGDGRGRPFPLRLNIQAETSVSTCPDELIALIFAFLPLRDLVKYFQNPF